MRKTIFIASSGNSVRLVRAVGKDLQGRGYSISMWTDAFMVGRNTVDELVRQLSETDYGVFVFGNDDQLLAPDAAAAPSSIPRDNVVFECGMFLGHKGKQHALIAVPSDAFTGNYKIASDLRGVTVATYDAKAWKKSNPAEAVIGTCDAIHEAISAQWKPLDWMEGYWLSRFQFPSGSGRTKKPKLLAQFSIEEVAVLNDTQVRGANGWILNENGPEGFRHRYTARIQTQNLYGTWHNLDGGHFGNFQLSLKKASTRMVGSWTGNGSSGGIETGTWHWCKIEDELSEEDVDKLKGLKLIWTSARQRALNRLIEPAQTRKVSKSELLKWLR